MFQITDEEVEDLWSQNATANINSRRVWSKSRYGRGTLQRNDFLLCKYGDERIQRKEWSVMPHITVKCYKGRSKEQLQKITTCAAEEFELSREVVSVSIEEVNKDKWSEIYYNEIYGNEETLFVAPKYTVD